jgi:mitochondrial fission protein ELM1
LSKFDLVAAPQHDRLEGQNVIPIIGAMHRITRAKLDSAAASFADTLNHLPRPRIAVLIGGANRSYRMTEAVARRLGQDLARIADKNGAGLMVTASRRTGLDNENLLRAAIGAGNKASNVMFWDNHGPNPYFAYLALADAVIITCDSVNMISEATATGKPVYIVPLEGGDAKFSAFHQMLYDTGIARPFKGELDHWSYEVPDEPKRVATEILRRMEAIKT